MLDARIGRRDVLRAGVAAATAALVAPRLAVAGAQEEAGPYGSLGEPDALGLMLPDGFTGREIARYGVDVGRSGYQWHRFPDGGATFETGDGGWIYVSNSEVPSNEGGVGAVRFDRAGEIVDAYPILTGTSMNCAGGPTPWGTWLSGEEWVQGRVWECDPTGRRDGRPLPALGVFSHEAAAVDPEREHVYLTEDHPEGRWYRFTADRYPDLRAGRLEVAQVGDGGRVSWLPVPDPSAGNTPTNQQVPESTVFSGGEGIWYRDGVVYFVTKNDGKVWRFDAAAERIETFYDPETAAQPVLEGPDNLTMSAFGDLIVCEDQPQDQQLVLIAADGTAAPILQLSGHDGSELTGAAFDPSGRRLYVSSQRGAGGPGITFEIRGPFRRPARAQPSTTTSPAATTTTLADGLARERQRRAGGGGDDGDFPVVPVAAGAGAAAVGLAALGVWRLRTRTSRTPG